MNRQDQHRDGPLQPHAMSIDDLAAALGADVDQGLEDRAASDRLAEYGPNRIGEDRGPSRRQLLARQFKDVLVIILIVAALISGVVLGDWIEASVIVAIVIVNAVIGYIQEARAADAAEGLRKLASPTAEVIRQGREREIATEEIVPGDLILLEAGDRVFADARVVSASRLRLDESELTGESTPVAKSTEPVAPDVSLGDRSSMVFSGTVVVEGRAKGLVASTGQATEIGQIAEMLSEEEPPTPLEKELARVGRRLGAIAGGVAAVVFLLGLAQGRPLESIFLLAVALAVAAIPEGLPAVVGVTLGLGVQRMARLNAIVRRLPAVEALGAVTVICTDKTGTLTRNEMRLQELALDDEVVTDLRRDDPKVIRIAELAVLCNDARHNEGEWHGDPTEVALLQAASEVADPAATKSEWPRIDEIPFESSRKQMITLHRSGDSHLVAVKGAPEVVVPSCVRVETDSGPSDLGPDQTSRWTEMADMMASRGLRTLALAYRRLESEPSELAMAATDLTLLGLAGLSDQIRDEAQTSVDEATGAGVTVVMITGDHEITATAIADELGLLESREVLNGSQLHSMDDEPFADEVGRVGAYARVDPSDKVRIVRALQAAGETVAMTGDGVNDAPALRIADVGVAMGSGTDVARDASDIVLADDNFATIVAAVRSGRTIFSNIRRVISFLLAANVSEIVVVLVGFLAFVNLGDPLLATQILWVNLVTDGLPAVALGFDPPDDGIMLRAPSRRRSLLDRSSQWAILIRGVILAGFVLLAYVFGMTRGLDWEVTRTLGFTTLVLVQLAYVYGLRVVETGWRYGLTRNSFLHAAVFLSVALQVLVVNTPVGNQLFSTASLTPSQWALTLGLSVAASLVLIALSKVFPLLSTQD